MKVLVRCNQTIESSKVSKVVEDAEKREKELKELFKDKSLSSLVYETPSRESDEFIDRYVVSRRLSGTGIEIYKQTVDAETKTKSFGGGVTLTKGYFYVAQYMNNIEPDMDKWEIRYSKT